MVGSGRLDDDTRQRAHRAWSNASSVSSVVVISAATETIAGQVSSSPFTCSNTNRTARSQTFGENVVALPITISSQGIQFRVKPGHFIKMRWHFI